MTLIHFRVTGQSCWKIEIKSIKSCKGRKLKEKFSEQKCSIKRQKAKTFSEVFFLPLFRTQTEKKKLLYIIGDPKIYIFQLNFWNRNPLENYTFKINSMNGSQQKFVSLNKMKSKKLAHISRISSLTKLDALYICVWIVCII